MCADSFGPPHQADASQAWNAFDMAYIVVFLLYLSLRVIALASRSPSRSDLAFDILACGACILFPRLVFFAIKDNVVILEWCRKTG